MSLLSTASQSRLSGALRRSMDFSRFTKLAHSTGRGDFGTTSEYTPGLTSFDGRVSVIDADEIHAGLSTEDRQILRLTTIAGDVTFSAKDRVRDEQDDSVYEILGDLGTQSDNATLHEWLIAKETANGSAR